MTGDQITAKQCYVSSLREMLTREARVDLAEEELKKVRPAPVEQMREVVLQEEPRRVAKIGSELQ